MKIILLDLASIGYPGGCEKYFANLAKFLSTDNAVISLGSKQFNNFMSYVYRIVAKRKLENINYITRDIGTASEQEISMQSLVPFTKNFQILKSQLLKADRIYTKNEFQELAFLYFILGRKQYEEKVIIGVHTPIFVPKSIKSAWKILHDLQYNSFFYKAFLRDARKIHVNNSDYVKLISTRYSVKTEKIIFIPNPIDWKTEIKGNGNKNFSIIWAGRLTSQKGIDRLEKIIDILSKDSDFSEITISLGGEGEEKMKIEELAQQYRNIKFLGFINDMDKEYSKSDLSIFTAYFDTFAHAVLEPQSYGIPVVSFNIPGPRDMIINGKTGYLVENEMIFAEKILYYFRLKKYEPKKYKQLQQLVYKSTNDRYSKTKIFKQLERVFY